jgi:hypothetical protein
MIPKQLAKDLSALDPAKTYELTLSHTRRFRPGDDGIATFLWAQRHYTEGADCTLAEVAS